MSVRIHEARKDDFACAVEFDELLAMLFDEGIAERVFGRADGNDFAAKAEDGGIGENAKIAESGTAVRAELRRG